MTRSLLAVHADWSVNDRKRWMCRAHREDGTWRISAPVRVGPTATLITRLLTEAAGAPVALGVDFPLGLPRAYAALAEIGSFVGWLRGLELDDPLFEPCATLDEINLGRPFYPRRSVAGPGQMARQAAALGLPDTAGLRRMVDFRTARRPAGAPLFWTMGANQCGKGAITGWRDFLLPGIAQGLPVRLWPYAGAFRDLLEPGVVAVAETYPTEAMVQLGLRLKGSKRRQSDRAALAPALRQMMGLMGVVPNPALAGLLDNGFGPSGDGEDPFDSVLGVLGLIRVTDGAPDGTEAGQPGNADVIRAIEGWVLGQVDPPLDPQECA